MPGPLNVIMSVWAKHSEFFLLKETKKHVRPPNGSRTAFSLILLLISTFVNNFPGIVRHMFKNEFFKLISPPSHELEEELLIEIPLSPFK